MACDHPNKYMCTKMARIEDFCPDCKRTLVTGCIPVPLEEYEELKEKAGKWDLSQLMTLQTLYGEKAFDLSNVQWDLPDEKELVATVMKTLSGAIKNGAVKIKAERILKKTCYNCTYANHYCDVTGKEEIVERMGHDFVCDSWRNDTITQEEDDG